MSKVTLGFDLDPLIVPIDKILPSRKTPMGVATSKKFMQIRSSIAEVGLIEPLSVGPGDPQTGQHVLLDGHIRLLALRELDVVEVQCLVATDDESYTYNSRINRLSTIQEHYMIRRAIQRGVTPERLPFDQRLWNHEIDAGGEVVIGQDSAGDRSDLRRGQLVEAEQRR